MRTTLLILSCGLCLLATCNNALRAAGLTSEVKNHQGVPALFVDGKLNTSLTFYGRKPIDVEPFRQAGIFIGDFSVPLGWVGPEKYDFTQTDTVMDEYLKIDPRLMAFPRFGLNPGDWWIKEFPDQISMRPDGTPAGFGAEAHQSFASARYRELAQRALRAFLTHMEKKYGDRIVGYFPGNGIYGEWFSWNTYWEIAPGGQHPTVFGVEDYSPPAQAAFRDWLRIKYRDHVEELRRAWGEPTLTFETASVPSEQTRKRPTHGIFFDPAISRQVPDYFEFYNDLVSDVLIEQCHWTKEFTGHRKVVGAFYGYMWTSYPHLTLNHSGHLGFSKVLRCPDIDFIAGPYTYDNRQLGGANNAQSLPAAIALHGKIYFNEVDSETHLQQRQWRWGDSLRNPRNIEETRGLLTRDFAYAFTGGFGMWYMELHGGTFNDPQIIQLLSQVKAADQKYLAAGKRSNTDIAVVLDEDSYRYFADGESFLSALISAQKSWHLNHLGAPFDSYLLSDLEEPGLRDYKFYLFLNTFRVTPAQRAAIHERLKRNHATAAWVYAPGYIGDEKLSVAGIEALTGIRVAEDSSPGELHVDITGSNHPYTKSLAKGFAYGTDVDVDRITQTYDHRIYLKDPADPGLVRDLPGFSIAPRFVGHDPKATVLGRLAGLNKPGFLVKQQDGWTSVYSSAPVLPAALLRNIARTAGCHIYTDTGDIVYADEDFLALYAVKGGERTIRLPRKARVVDVFDNRTVSARTSSFPLKMEANSARIFSLE